ERASAREASGPQTLARSRPVQPRWSQDSGQDQVAELQRSRNPAAHIKGGAGRHFPSMSPAIAPVLNPATLEGSYRYCRDVARKRAKNFYYSFLLLEKPQRDPLCSIY